MIRLLAIFICGTALAANTAYVGTLNVGGASVGGGGGWTPPTWTPDTFGTGANEFTIEFVTVGDPGNPGKTGTDYVWDPGSVPYTYRIAKYEISWGQLRRAIAAGGLPIIAQPAVVDGPFAEDDMPAAKVTPMEAFIFANWLNQQAGYAPAYNIGGEWPTFTFNMWPAEDSWNEGGVTNRFRHKRTMYFVPSLDEFFKAGMWNAALQQWMNYGQGFTDPPISVNGFYGGSTAVNTGIHAQALDERYPEFDSPGNESSVTLTTSAGAITNLAFSAYVSGHSSNVFTNVDFTITQGAATTGKARVATYDAIRVPAQFEIINSGTGYQGFPNNASLWNSATGYQKDNTVSLTIGGNTVTAYCWTTNGTILGIKPYAGKFATEDTSTEIDIVQAGGSGGKARCIRYVTTYVPATFGSITGGSGYTNGPAVIRTAAATPTPTFQCCQIWQGAAPVYLAGGLSPWGAMGLDGNVHEYSDQELDGINDQVADIAFGDYAAFYSSYYNYKPGGWVSGHVTEMKPYSESILSTSADTFEGGFRVGSKVLP